MHETDLFLSHWDASIPVRVPANVVKDLTNYHIMGVRFLYDCFRKGQKGAILNPENGMNPQIQVAAFLNALSNFITPVSPVLVVCSEESLNAWHYHLTIHGGYAVVLLSFNNYEEVLQGKFHRVVLSTLDNVKLLREIKETDFFSVVVDDLDQVAAKNVIKQLKSQFNIGVTYRNFLKQQDQKLFWTIVNWSNPGVLQKFAEFCSEDNDNLQNLRYPYGAWWQRLTWNFCESFKQPSEEENKQYKSCLHKWSRQKIRLPELPKPEPKRQTRKRKAKDSSKDVLNIKQEEDLEEPIKNIRRTRNNKRHAENFKAEAGNSSKDVSNVEQEEELEKNIKNSKLRNTRSTKNILKNQDKNILNKITNDLSDSEDVVVKNENRDSQNLNSSQETIAYDFKNSPPHQDDDDILTSIISTSSNSHASRPFDDSQSRVKEEVQSLKGDASSSLTDTTQMDESDDDILTSIISSKSSVKQENSSFSDQTSSKNSKLHNSEIGSCLDKDEILSALYGDVE